MAAVDSENFKIFENLVADTGNTFAFDGETSVKGMGALLEIIKDMGFNPMQTNELKKGMMSLFNIEIINMPDLENNRFIFTPNHVSDLDALILGLIHPKIRIVAKTDWTNNEKLRKFLDIHYDLYGLERMSIQSLRDLFTGAVNYFNESGENRHFLIFSQGTISDFNNNSPERITPIAQRISNKTDVPVVIMFIEQVSFDHPTRIVFDNPMKISPENDFREIWLEREKALQKTLIPPARLPKLTYKHANNNKPGDPFFQTILKK